MKLQQCFSYCYELLFHVSFDQMSHQYKLFNTELYKFKDQKDEILSLLIQNQIIPYTNSYSIHELNTVILICRAYVYDIFFKDYCKAMEDCQQILSTPNLYTPITTCLALYRRARLYYNQEMYLEAKSDLEQCLSFCHNKFSFAFNNLANICKDYIVDWDEALHYYDMAVLLSPLESVFVRNRGFLYETMQKYDNAIADYEESIRIDPTDAQAYFRKAHYLDVKQGNKIESIPFYNKSIELDPLDHNSYNNIANILKDYLHDHNKALQCYNKTIELNPSESMYYTNRALLYQSLNENDKALQDYHEAIKVQPEDFTCHFKLGYLLADKLHKPLESLQHYTICIKIYKKLAKEKSNKVQTRDAKINVAAALNNRSIGMASIFPLQICYTKQYNDLNLAIRLDTSDIYLRNRASTLVFGFDEHYLSLRDYSSSFSMGDADVFSLLQSVCIEAKYDHEPLTNCLELYDRLGIIQEFL